MADITLQVGASSDDAGRHYGVGSQYWTTTNAYLTLGNYGGACKFGCRFTNVTIPQGSTINSAILQFRAYAGNANTTVNVDVYGEAIDDSPTFSTEADFDGRTKTTAKVDWNNIESWVSGNWYNSPEIKTVIQEIINRAGWASGNDLSVLIFDDASTSGINRMARTYDYATADAPKLVITYTSGGATYTKTWTTDTLFKKLGITKTLVLDVDFKKRDITKAYIVDSLFQKKDVQIQRQVDTLFKKLDILKTFGADVNFLKKDVVKSFAVDARFGAAVTYTISRQIDVLFEKLGVTRTFGIDAYFGAVGAIAYTKSFALDVVFAYKVRLPEIWFDEEGRIVLNVSRPYVWVGS